MSAVMPMGYVTHVLLSHVPGVFVAYHVNGFRPIGPKIPDLIMFIKPHPCSSTAKSNSTQHFWLVTLQGGGWCWNASDCYNRSLGLLGSSYKLPAVTQFDGIMSANFTVNPEFYNWNMVMINYCDGASFSGIFLL